MHIKAIQIKEQLLGQEDYEVALSVGHLASLYNYDMNQYENAEKLYLRSIAIGRWFLKCVTIHRAVLILQETLLKSVLKFLVKDLRKCKMFILYVCSF